MLAKLWKKVLMLVLIIACLFNVVTKLVKSLSIDKELLSSARYIQSMQDQKKAEEEKKKSNSTNNTSDTKTEKNTVNNKTKNQVDSKKNEVKIR